MKRGRPTLYEQKKIKDEIFLYYENNIDAITASRKTGINYKTILKYYGIWDRETFELEKNDHLTRIKIAKARAIRMLDNQLLPLIHEQQTIQRLIDTALQIGNTSEYDKLARLKIKMSEQILEISSAKINLVGTPTADIIINQKDLQNDL
jgi:hypothetical protein